MTIHSISSATTYSANVPILLTLLLRPTCCPGAPSSILIAVGKLADVVVNVVATKFKGIVDVHKETNPAKKTEKSGAYINQRKNSPIQILPVLRTGL